MLGLRSSWPSCCICSKQEFIPNNICSSFNMKSSRRISHGSDLHVWTLTFLLLYFCVKNNLYKKMRMKKKMKMKMIIFLKPTLCQVDSYTSTITVLLPLSKFPFRQTPKDSHRGKTIKLFTQDKKHMQK